MDDNGDPLWAEAKTALMAVSSSHNLGLYNVIFEGDALNVFEAIQNSSITLGNHLYHSGHQHNL